jgi:hypothetical protein
MVVWIRKFIIDRYQRARVERHYTEEVRDTSGVPQESVLGPLLFLAYVNDIWRDIQTTIGLFANDCIIYRKILRKRKITERSG